MANLLEGMGCGQRLPVGTVAVDCQLAMLCLPCAKARPRERNGFFITYPGKLTVPATCGEPVWDIMTRWIVAGRPQEVPA